MSFVAEKIETPAQIAEALKAYGLNGRSDLTKAVYMTLCAPKVRLREQP